MKTTRHLIVFSAVLLSAGILWTDLASGALSSEELDLRKGEVIRESLQKLGRPVENATLLEATGQAEALLEIQIERDVRETRISIVTTGKPAYDTFPLGDRRIVIDIWNTINFHSGETYETTEPSVLKSVRTSLFQLEPQFISRIVLDLDKMVDVQISQQDRAIQVMVPEDVEVPSAVAATPEAPVETAQVAVEQPAVPEAEPAERLPEAQTAEEPAAAEEKIERLEAVLAKAEAEKGKVADLERALESERRAQAELQTKLEKELEAERAARAELEAKLKEQFDQQKAEALAASEQKIGELELALAEAEAQRAAVGQLKSELEAARQARDEADAELKEEKGKGEALAVAEQKMGQLELALAEAAEASRAEAGTAIKGLREQLARQKQAYAELNARADADLKKHVAALEQTLRAELEKKKQEARATIEAQRIALAELKDRLAATKTAEKEALAKEPVLAMEVLTSEKVPEPAVESKRVAGVATPAGLVDQTVTLTFTDAELSAVLDILARKANINLLAGKEVTGTVTARLVDVPLMQAMELVLRENSYGLVHQNGIYRVVSLDRAEEMGVGLATETFKLRHALASDISRVMDELVTAKGKVVANDSANVLIITDEPVNMPRLRDVIREIDVAETVVDTLTGTFRLSYLDATPVADMLAEMVTEHGAAIADDATNTLILTDTPGNFQVISGLIEELDQRPDQVYIEVLMVDAVLSDDSEFGVDWLARATQENHGGNLSDLMFDTALGNVGTSETLNAGIMTLGILSKDFQLDAVIAAEVQTRDATILADPRILVINNETASIEIVTEVPYQEITQTGEGAPIASTEFKDIGVTLEVSPRITHENTVILRIVPEESSISGYTGDGVPIEDARRADTSVMLDDGQTAVVGGLRNVAHSRTTSKVPWLGDIPFLGRLFRHTVSKQANTELLVFLTVHIVKGLPPELTPYERSRFDEMGAAPRVPDATRDIWEEMRHPWGKQEPFWRRRNRER